MWVSSYIEAKPIRTQKRQDVEFNYPIVLFPSAAPCSILKAIFVVPIEYFLIDHSRPLIVDRVNDWKDFRI